MFKYSINLAWSNEDECYIATISEFPGLSAFGDTPAEAAEEAKIAAEGFLKVYREDGCPVPEPETIKPFSGQTRLRLPKTLHATLSQEAKKEGVSLNSYVVHLLSERHIVKELEQKINDLRNITLLSVLPTGPQTMKPGSDIHTARYNFTNWEDTIVTSKTV
jgi:predicted RNase H-like HicB family nuclease